jgi:hypothetical protein
MERIWFFISNAMAGRHSDSCKRSSPLREGLRRSLFGILIYAIFHPENIENGYYSNSIMKLFSMHER